MEACVPVRVRVWASVNKNFKEPPTAPPYQPGPGPAPNLCPAPLLDVSSMYLGDLSCRCTVLVWDCICVCARTGPRQLTAPKPHPPVLSLPTCTVRVYSPAVVVVSPRSPLLYCYVIVYFLFFVPFFCFFPPRTDVMNWRKKKNS